MSLFSSSLLDGGAQPTPGARGGWYPGSWGSSGSLERRMLMAGTVLCTVTPALAAPSWLPSHTSWTILCCTLVSWCSPSTRRFRISAQVMVLVTARPEPTNTSCLTPPPVPCSPCTRAKAKPMRLWILLPSLTLISSTPAGRSGKGLGVASSVRHTLRMPPCPCFRELGASSPEGKTGGGTSRLVTLPATEGWLVKVCTGMGWNKSGTTLTSMKAPLVSFGFSSVSSLSVLPSRSLQPTTWDNFYAQCSSQSLAPWLTHKPWSSEELFPWWHLHGTRTAARPQKQVITEAFSMWPLIKESSHTDGSPGNCWVEGTRRAGGGFGFKTSGSPYACGQLALSLTALQHCANVTKKEHSGRKNPLSKKFSSFSLLLKRQTLPGLVSSSRPHQVLSFLTHEHNRKNHK